MQVERKRVEVRADCRVDARQTRIRSHPVGPRWWGLLVLLLLLSTPSITLADPQARIVVAAVNDVGTGDGLVVGVRASAPWDELRSALAVGADSTLRSAFGRVYAVSRSAENVSVIDAATWTVEQVIPTGAGSEPVDIAIVDESTGYVSRRGATHLLRVDLDSWTTTPVVDLSPLADADGIPEMSMMIVHEGRLIVQLERFSNGVPFGFIPPATLAVVDLATEQLVDMDPIATGVQGIELVGTAPKHKMQIGGATDTLYVSASGEFFDEGGLEAVDLASGQSNGLILAESDGRIGADLGSFTLVSPSAGYLVFSTDLIPSSHLVDFTTDGFVDSDSEIISIVEYRAPTILYDRDSDTIFLPQGKNREDGLHVFAAADGTRLTTSPVPLPGRPTDVALVCDAAVACGDPACPTAPPCARVPALGPPFTVLLVALVALGASQALRRHPTRA